MISNLLYHARLYFAIEFGKFFSFSAHRKNISTYNEISTITCRFCGGKDLIMTLDKRSINMLLSLDDQRLASVIRQLAANAGLPAESLNLGARELQGIREALSLANDGDVSRAAELIEEFKKGKKG